MHQVATLGAILTESYRVEIMTVHAVIRSDSRPPVWVTAANAGRLVGVDKSAGAREMNLEE